MSDVSYKSALQCRIHRDTCRIKHHENNNTNTPQAMACTMITNHDEPHHDTLPNDKLERVLLTISV